jgi:hypothetical protein
MNRLTVNRATFIHLAFVARKHLVCGSISSINLGSVIHSFLIEVRSSSSFLSAWQIGEMNIF